MSGTRRAARMERFSNWQLLAFMISTRADRGVWESSTTCIITWLDTVLRIGTHFANRERVLVVDLQGHMLCKNH